MDDSSNLEVIEDNFQLEVNYAYVDQNRNNRNDYFLIDVVSFDRLDFFLNQIESDIDAIFQVIRD